jgi:vitamin B12 transporter
MSLSHFALLWFPTGRASRTRLALGLVLAVYAGPSAAQTRAIPHIVISATGIPTPAELVANSVTVITDEEIQREQRRSVPDLLATVPGVNVVQTGGIGGATSVFMRGTNPNHTKVLLDGIDMSDPSLTNRIFDLGQLSTAGIERIEVLRGPQSGLYGADAIGGVVSITTKRGSGPTKVSGLLEAGSFGTFNQTAHLSGSKARFHYAFTAAHLRSASTPVTPPELLPPGQRPIDNSYDNWTLSTQLGANLSENLAVNLVGRYTDSRLLFAGDDFNVFPAVIADQPSTQNQQQFFTRGEALWSLFDGRMKNHFGIAFSDLSTRVSDPNNTPVVTTNDGDRIKYDWRSYTTIIPGHVLLLGLEKENERLRTNTVSAELGNTGAYAQIQSEVARRFFLVANIRTDDNQRFGSHTTWRIAPALRVPVAETKLKASYGTGFKAPTLSQLFVDFPSFGFTANRNLRPETSTGYDYGFEQPLDDGRVVFGVTWFHNDIKDLINFNSSFTSNDNIGSATAQGYESFVSLAVTERLKLRADYTRTSAINNITGTKLLRRPKHKASVTATWNPTDPLTLSATVLYVGSWLDVDRFGTAPAPFAADHYTLVNLAADYAINQNIKVFGRIDNLFDRRYQNPVGFERPGLAAFAGIRGTM